MNKIKVGVIGTGALGRHHSRLYAANPLAQVIGIYDACYEQAQRVGAEFGLPVFRDCAELVNACDALSVAVPATLHAETVLPLLKAGKHVLTEKPIDATIEGAEAMCRCAAQNGVILAAGHVERFNPAMDYYRSIDGSPIRRLELRREAAYPPPRPGLPPRGTEVSVVLDLMIHDIDLALYLTGSEPVQVEAQGITRYSPSFDRVDARIVFAGGAVADLTASRISCLPERKMRLFRDADFMELDFSRPQGIRQMYADTPQNSGEALEFASKNALADELDDFLRCVSGEKKRPLCAGTDALAALRLAQQIELAAVEHQKRYGDGK